MHMIEKSGRLINMSSVDDAPPLQFVYWTNAAYASVVLDFAQFPSLDERGKLDFVLLLACQVCADHTEPAGGSAR